MTDSIMIKKMEEIVRSAEGIFENREDSQKVHTKGRADYVTEVDFHVQQYLQRRLLEEFPDVQMMGEEKDNSDIDFSKKVWILDPVDGTTNLIHDMRASAISLGYVEGGKIAAGVIFLPFSGEMYTAERGKGAFLNGHPIHVSAAETLDECLISVGTAPYYHEYADWTFEAAKKVFLRSQDIRRSGSAAMELSYIAAGRLDGTFERILQPWDFSAGICILEEAGGKATDFDGNPVDFTKKGPVVASNGKVHEELLDCIR
ncbi:MAG: inositol monophosphatase [Eubacteriales bacterium]|jgi:myo-inositol-1(or 4)-monophosphatase